MINVLIVCSDAVLARALPGLLDGGGGRPAPIQVQSSPRGELAHRLGQWSPDVLLLEHPGDDDALDRLLAGVRAVSPSTRTLVLLPSPSDDRQLHLLHEGVCGALLTAEVGAVAARAIRAVHGGQLWFSRAFLRKTIQLLLGAGPRPIAFLPGGEQGLTPREAEIVHLIGEGLSNKEIARELQISDQTVKTHLHHVYVKLQRSGRYKAFRTQGWRTDASPPSNGRAS